METKRLARIVINNVRENLGKIMWKYYSGTIISKNTLTVLMLHRIIPDDCESIGDHHLCITTKKLVEIITILRKKFTLCDLYYRPKHSNNRNLSFTFDDGWQDNYHIAKQYFNLNGIPYTIFLTAGMIGTNKNLWFHSLDLLFDKIDHAKILIFFRKVIPEPFTINNTTDIIHVLKKLPFKQINDAVQKAEKEFNVQIQHSPKPTLLNWEQVSEMAEAGATFGSHGMQHAIMSVLDTKDKLYEAHESFKILKNKVKTFIPVYSFPNGLYTKECIEICKNCGYSSGLSANLEMQQFDNLFKIIPRISISESMSINIVKYRICLAHIKRKTG